MTAAIRILYVDDEPPLLDIGKLFLEESGDFAVTTALSAAEALRLLEQEKFDAIISDYQMPGLDGIQFLVEVRSRFGPIPFILFTGRGREEVVIQAINSGADFYLQKGGEAGAQFAELSHKVRQAALRNRAEDSLRKSEEKYRHLIEHSNEAIVVVQDGMLKLVNYKTVEFTGYSEQELLSRSISAFIHPDDRAMVVERYQERIKGEELPSHYAFRLSTKNGNTRWVEISVVVIDWDGRPATLNFLTDITERNQAEEALRKSEEKFRKAFFISPDSICITRMSDGMFVSINKGFTEITGYTEEDVAGKTSLDINVWKDPEDRRKIVEELKAKGEVRNYEVRFLTKSGEISGLMSTSIIELNGVPHILNITHDITERKLAEEALLKNTEELRQNVDDLEKSERALLESEKRYRLIDDASLDYIYSYDLGGHFTSANRSLCAAMKLRSNQILGRTHAELGFPDAQCRDWDDLHQRVFKTGTTVTSLTSTPMPDGTIRHYEVVLNPLHDSEGTITGIAGTTRDITDRKHAEEALQESEGLLKTIVTNLHGIVFSVDKEGIFLLSEGKSLSSLGLKPGQVVGQSVFDVYKDVPEIIAGMKTALSGELWSGISHVQDIFFDTFVTPVFDSSKMVSGAVGIATEITDRKHTEDSLRESETSYRGLFNTIRHAIYILNPGGTFVDVNEGAEAMYGYAREEFLGRTPEFLSAPGKNDLAAVMEYIRKAFAGEPQLFEFWGLRKGGEIFPKDVSLYKGTYFGKDVIVAVGADITERKRGEVALMESEIKHRALFESIADTVFLIDQKTGNILDVNPAASRQYGFDHDEFVRMNAVDVSAEPEQTVRAIERPVSNIPLRYHHRKDGSIFPVELTASKFELHGKTIIIATARDITERKQAEETIRQVNRKLKLMSGITRHDISNQLTVQMGYLSILEKKEPDTTHNEYVQKVSTAAHRIAAMIQFTKEYEEIGVHAPTWQDCLILVNTAAKQAPLGKVTVKNDLPAGAEVFADPLITKVFYNLMDNAVRYGGKITTIRFSVEEHNGNHLMVCEDDGDGVGAEEKEKIFDRGYGKNTGLGLALSREILSITGITIKETGEPGEGTRFEMVVPKGSWRMNDNSQIPE